MHGAAPNDDKRKRKIERGDWQTPEDLAAAALRAIARVADRSWAVPPETIIEPTCGTGAFLAAAAREFPRARLFGWEIDGGYAYEARTRLPKERADITVANFFDVPWEDVFARLPEPVLVIGNPPWVTSSELGRLEGDNAPSKSNARGLRGIEARTGKSNFDVSEWMIVRLVEAMAHREGALAMLCKLTVARKVIETIARRKLPVHRGELRRIDARRHFAAAVDAVLFVAMTTRASTPSPRMRAPRARLPRPRELSSETLRWPVYSSMVSTEVTAHLEMKDGSLVHDGEAFARTKHLSGVCEPQWRSGVKHDCAQVMELIRAGDGTWQNGLGERVEIERERLFPLLKSSDVSNERSSDGRAIIVTQTRLGEDTEELRRSAPRTWKYLARHRARFDARKSSIYEGQPPFAMFGVGPYTFAKWKVAVSGFSKRPAFVLVEPHQGRPVLLDDTCYFLAFDDERAARRASEVLRSRLARDFFDARIFWDAKRPITKSVLQALDLDALDRACAPEPRARQARRSRRS